MNSQDILQEEFSLGFVTGFATAAHARQMRKYTGTPYIEHPLRVADLLIKFGCTEPQVIAAAILHDTVEDTDVTLEHIKQYFGDDVAYLVNGCTEPQYPLGEDGKRLNREARKQLDLEHYAKGDARVQAIKVADLIDNTSDIFRNDKDFARIYVKEKLKLLDALVEAPKELRDYAYAQCQNLQRLLDEELLQEHLGTLH